MLITFGLACMVDLPAADLRAGPGSPLYLVLQSANHHPRGRYEHRPGHNVLHLRPSSRLPSTAFLCNLVEPSAQP